VVGAASPGIGYVTVTETENAWPGVVPKVTSMYVPVVPVQGLVEHVVPVGVQLTLGPDAPNGRVGASM